MPKYNLSFVDEADIVKIIKIFMAHLEIMNELSKNSKESAEGGAAMSYDLEIKLKEKWT